jgi:hypothetical protein
VIETITQEPHNQMQDAEFDKIELIDLLNTSELNMNKKLNDEMQA